MKEDFKHPLDLLKETKKDWMDCFIEDFFKFLKNKRKVKNEIKDNILS